MGSWTPQVGKTLRLKREPTNSVDKYAVAVMKDGVIVGHVPYNIAHRFSQFLIRDVNKAFAEVTGKEQGSRLRIRSTVRFWTQDIH